MESSSEGHHSGVIKVPAPLARSGRLVRTRSVQVAGSAESSSSDHIAMRGTFSEGVMVPLNMPVVLRGIATKGSRHSVSSHTGQVVSHR